MRWQAVVFDLDDTLYPEREYVLSGFRAAAAWAAATYGVDEAAAVRALTTLFESGVRGNTFDLWRTGLNLPSESVSGMIRGYREHMPSLRPFPEVEPLLTRLRPHVKTGVVSDGWAAVQRRKLAALALEKRFDAVVCSDELGGRAFWKPSTAPFEAVLQQLGVAPSQAVYCADNCAKDFFGARALGMSTVRVVRAGAEYFSVQPEGPDWAPDLEIDSLAALGDLVFGGGE